MSRRAIRYIGSKSGRYPAVALSLALGLTIFGIMVALNRFHVEMDVAALLPEDSKMAQAGRKPLSDFVGHGFVLGVLEIKDTAPPEIRENPAGFLTSIKPKLSAALNDQRFFRDRSRMRERRQLGLAGNDVALVSLFIDEDFTPLEQLTVPSVLEMQLADLSARLGENPTTDTLRRLATDPFGLEETLRERSGILAGPLQQPSREGFHVSEDGRMLLLALWPVEPSTDLLFVRKMKQFLTETREGLYKRNPEWRNALSIEFVGSHVENAAGARSVKNDILLTTSVSFAAVLILFFVAFRQPEALIFVAVPLIVGMAFTLGFTSLFVKRITQITFIFAAIIIGLGIDFSIHLYNRYLEDLRLGHSREHALRTALTYTGPSIVAGAITTGFAFFGMLLSRFIGFRELGLFGGIGIIMSLVAMALTLPALMIVFSRFSSRVRAPVATFGLKKITFTVTAYPRMTVAAGLCLAVYFGIHARHVTFDTDFQSLRQPSDGYTDLMDRVRQHFYLPSDQVFVIIEDSTLEGVLEKNDRLFERLQAAQRTYNFVGIDSMRMIYPSPPTQLANLQRLRDFPVDTLRQQVQRRLEDYPNVPADFFETFFRRVANIQENARIVVERRQPLIGMGTLDDPSFHESIQYYIYRTHDPKIPAGAAGGEGGYRVITRVYPPTGQWVAEIPDAFAEYLSEGFSPPPLILGSAVLATELKEYILFDLATVVIAVLVFVLVYLMFYFRNPLRACLALVPIGFSLLFMLGAMHFLEMRMNYLNIIAIPILVGIGVDSGIHLMGRFYEEQKHNLRLAIERTGRAIVITNLTTIFGFGSLSIASFPGIREIGILTIIGTMGTLFAALVFLPAVLRLMDPEVTYKGGAGDEIG